MKHRELHAIASFRCRSLWRCCVANALLYCGLVCTLIPYCAVAETVSFQKHVLPLLSDRCFHCHGPDESHREADLRLDLKESAIQDRGGYAAIVPGDPDASEAFQRITSDDESMVMPPIDSHRESLTQEEIELIWKWIESGAEWGRHWAFQKPRRPEVPTGAIHPIDAFVRRRLEEQGLKPSGRAQTHTLARRVAFDLTGLPPTAKQVERLSEESAGVEYRKLVDQLLASPQYGERMAMWWLDAARYSDTDGFQQDETRDNWPWRDWVIESFNENMPFDRFTVEQFAGDLLPNATTEQKLATCFHRNHQTNGEGGRDHEESRIDYVIDRVNTTGTVWLGLTLGCCQCHSHKFDPISQKEYYQLSAFFNSIDETGAAGKKADPYLEYTSPYVHKLISKADELLEHRRSNEREQEKLAEPEFEAWLYEKVLQCRSGHSSWSPLMSTNITSQGGERLTQLEDASILARGKNPSRAYYRVVAEAPKQKVTAVRLEVLTDPSHTHGRLSRNELGTFVLTGFKLQLRHAGQAQVQDIEISRAVADLEQVADDEMYGAIRGILHDDPRNGWTLSAEQSSEPHEAILFLDEPLQLEGDEQLIATLSHGSVYKGANIGRFRLSVSSDPAQVLKPTTQTPLEELAESEVASPADIPEELRSDLRRHFLAVYAPYRHAKEMADLANRQAVKLRGLRDEVNVMVLTEREKPRPTFVLERGVWDQHGDKVEAGVPQAVLPWAPDRTKTRLDLANWIVDPDNPLTARVIVNQLWQLCFGSGLVRTPEDFGLQGEMPTHPDLLDWLAVELIESGWDVKHIMRLIVTSETYQQSSEFTPVLLERDPDNKLLARGSRFRLPSWMIRDAALSYSGLLDDSFGGPPVLPYQPAGVWDALFKGKYTYDTSQGALQFRRTVYAFWRRSSSPTFLFDIAPRRVCEVRTRLTNTPLHALTLMNDLGQLEAARALAVGLVERELDTDGRIDWMFQHVVSRSPTDEEHQILRNKLDDWLMLYSAEPDKAREFLAFGQPELYVTENCPETAAYTVLANLLLNLDEVITHE